LPALTNSWEAPVRVLIVPNRNNGVALAAAEDLATGLAEAGREAVLLAEDGAACGRPDLCVARDALGDLDLVVALGGDGTILRAAHVEPDASTPILGVNLGTLGFLSGVGPEDVRGSVDRALAGEGRVERRATLTVRLWAGGREAGSHRALNEVYVGRATPSRVVELEVRINGGALSHFYADGVIVATPTGSTAYALSLGGPIMSPAVGGFLVVPAAAHTLSARPLVLASDDVAEIALPNPRRADACVTVDGDSLPCRTAIERITVTGDGPEVRLVKLDGTSFYDVVRAKFLGG
jgi:NAD+ kinase